MPGYRTAWSTDEINLVRENWQTRSDEELAAMLPGRTWRGVKLMRSRMELLKSRVPTLAHVEFIRDNWREMSDAEMAAQLGLYVGSVANIRQRSGWHRLDGRGRGAAMAIHIHATMPPAPRGYTQEQMEWAMANRGRLAWAQATPIEREARTILGMYRDPAAKRRIG